MIAHTKYPVELVSVEVVCQRDEFDSFAQKNQHSLHVDSEIKSKVDIGWPVIFWEGGQSHNLQGSFSIQKPGEVIVLASSLAKRS